MGCCWMCSVNGCCDVLATDDVIMGSKSPRDRSDPPLLLNSEKVGKLFNFLFFPTKRFDQRWVVLFRPGLRGSSIPLVAMGCESLKLDPNMVASEALLRKSRPYYSYEISFAGANGISPVRVQCLLLRSEFLQENEDKSPDPAGQAEPPARHGSLDETVGLCRLGLEKKRGVSCGRLPAKGSSSSSFFPHTWES